MTIYIDIILLENLCMNYAILFGTGMITKSPIRIIRLLVSSLIGGGYAVISYMNIIPVYSNFFFKILLSLIMVYVCFGSPTIKILLKQILIFYLVSFVFGGCAFALLYFLSPESIISKNGLLIGTYPIKVALLSAIIGFIMLQIAFRLVKTKFSKKDLVCTITIYVQGKEKEIKAIIDTGNLLKEPITGLPVVVVEKDALVGVLPENILNNIKKIILGEIEDIENLYEFKFRVIPFTSLGKENGLLLGIKADKIKVQTKEESLDSKEVIIGLHEGKLSKNDSYNALIGLDMIERSTNEYFRDVKV